VPVRQGRYAEAVEPYWRAVSLAANKAGPLGNVAVVLYLSEEFEDAVDVRLQALVWARLDERDRLEKVIAQLIKAGYSEALIKRDANFGGSANSNHAIPRKSAPQSVQRDVFVDDSLGEPEIDS
jgi:Flp pilus assembly protein TadD